MTPRGCRRAPARTVLGQRALEPPTVLVTNQHSLSDAEDFTEGYRALKLGKVVGEPTAGWIIYTSNARADRRLGRAPAAHAHHRQRRARTWSCTRARWTCRSTRPVGESYAGKDAQLDAAVRELLGQLGERTSRRE